MCEHLIEPYEYVGLKVNVIVNETSEFLFDFVGTVIGVKNGFLQVRDQDDDVWDVEISQVSIVRCVKPCSYCNRIDCICSDEDVSIDMGAKG